MLTTPGSVQYRYVTLRQCELAASAQPLTAREASELERLRDAGRRQTFLAGRYLLKQLVSAALARAGTRGVKPAELEIRARNERGRKTRPVAWHAGVRLPFVLALAHSPVGVLAALAAEGAAVGVDLAEADARPGPGFAALWFTEAERTWFTQHERLGLAAAWAIKEAAYKALNRGEAFEPRHWRIEPDRHGRLACVRQQTREVRACRVTLWRTAAQEVAVLATAPSATWNSLRELAHD